MWMKVIYMVEMYLPRIIYWTDLGFVYIVLLDYNVKQTN